MYCLDSSTLEPLGHWGWIWSNLSGCNRSNICLMLLSSRAHPCVLTLIIRTDRRAIWYSENPSWEESHFLCSRMLWQNLSGCCSMMPVHSKKDITESKSQFTKLSSSPRTNSIPLSNKLNSFVRTSQCCRRSNIPFNFLRKPSLLSPNICQSWLHIAHVDSFHSWFRVESGKNSNQCAVLIKYASVEESGESGLCA